MASPDLNPKPKPKPKPNPNPKPKPKPKPKPNANPNPNPNPSPNLNPNPNQVLGGFAGMPLLFNEPLSLVGLVTLYSTGAIAAKIVLRWRFSKAYY